MEYVNIVFLALVVLFFIGKMMPTKGVNQITTEDLKKQLNDKNKQFIDVRTAGEFKGNNIKGFKNIPLHTLGSKSSNLLKDKEVVVICQSGMRSNKASKLLKKKGFKHVTNVKGGMSAWS